MIVMQPFSTGHGETRRAPSATPGPGPGGLRTLSRERGARGRRRGLWPLEDTFLPSRFSLPAAATGRRPSDCRGVALFY